MEGVAIPDELTLGYAHSRATCKGCGIRIDDGELRCMKLVRTGFDDGLEKRSYHYDCAEKFAKKLSDWKGLAKLEWRDVIKVAHDCGVENRGLPCVQKQHEARIALSAQLENRVDLDHMLKSNGLFVGSDAADAQRNRAYRVADALLFGVLPPCPVCGERSLVGELSDIVCCRKGGSTPCDFAFRVAPLFEDEPRGSFQIGDPGAAKYLRRECAFVLKPPGLDNMPPTGWVGGFESSAVCGSGGGFAEAGWINLDSDDEADQLQGFRFCATDDVFNEYADLDEKICLQGGKCTPELVLMTPERTTHVVTRCLETDTVKLAEKANIPVVSPEFVFALLETNNTVNQDIGSVHIRGRQPGKPNGHLNGRYLIDGDRYVHTNGMLELCFHRNMWRIKPVGQSGSFARARETWSTWPVPCGESPVLPTVWEVYDGKRFRPDPEVVTLVAGKTKPTGPRLWQRKWMLPYLLGSSGIGRRMQNVQVSRKRRLLRDVAPSAELLKVDDGFKARWKFMTREEEEDLTIFVKNNHVYNATLQYGDEANGSSKYQVLQLVQYDGSYHVYKKMGRVGDKPRSDLQTFDDCDDAIEAFKKEFLDRTGQDFHSELEFGHLPGRYAVVETDSDEPDRKRLRCKGSGPEVGCSDSALPTAVQACGV